MLKRSFYFTLFFLGCCGETQAMLSTVVVPAGSEMKKVQSQHDLDPIKDRVQVVPPRRLAMSDSGILTTPLLDITGVILNGGSTPAKRASISERPVSVRMVDQEQEDDSETAVAGKDVNPSRSPKATQLLLTAIVAKQASPEEKREVAISATSPKSSAPADEYVEEVIIFPGYIKTIWVKKCQPVTRDNWYESFCCGH